MVKEFDIYLKRRITECDLIVYSLPYRDGLTATNRIILESCIESYTLQKFVAMQFGSELVSHIDKMIKTCYERLNWGTAISADAVFQTGRMAGWLLTQKCPVSICGNMNL